MGYSQRNVDQLCAHYFNEITQIGATGIIVVAGICQGGLIARGIADRLRDSGRKATVLTLVEQARLISFDGDVAFFCAAESPLNPFRESPSRLAAYEEIYRGRCSIDVVPAGHHDLMNEPNVRGLAAKTRNRSAV